MRVIHTLLILICAAFFSVDECFAQEPPAMALPQLVYPGVSGSSPDVLHAKEDQSFSDWITPKIAIDRLSEVSATPRKIRGAQDVILYRNLSPSVALIVTKDTLGSGSVVAGGLILTNWHVVGEQSDVGVIYKPDGQGSEPSSAGMVSARVIKIDKSRDLALLRPSSIPPGTKPIELGDRNSFAVGSDVHAIGHPSGAAWTYTKGIISQLRDSYSWNAKPNFSFRANVIQTQTPISPGSSGGPLLSDDGKLVGVNSFKDSSAQAVNFAVSVVDVRSFLAASENAVRVGTPASECKGKVLFEGRDANNSGFMKSVSLKCNQIADFVVFLPDDANKPMVAYYDSKGRNKPDALIFDPTRTSHWKYSFWDADLDDTFALKGIHIDGNLAPAEFQKRCKGRAAPNLRCL